MEEFSSTASCDARGLGRTETLIPALCLLTDQVIRLKLTRRLENFSTDPAHRRRFTRAWSWV
jgi:hypothetical protein